MNSRLSPAGEARRAAMLRELQAAMARRHARIRGMRTCVAAITIVAISTALVVHRRPGAPAPSPHVPEPPGRIATVFVATDDEIVQRLTVPSGASRVERIADGDLWQWLADSGLVEGWIRIGDRVILAHDVAPPRGAPTSPDNAS